MLPRSDGIWESQTHRLVGLERPNAIGYETILRPIAAADDIAGAHRGDRRTSLKEAVAEAARQQLRASFAVAVRVMTPEAVALDKGAALIVIFIHLVAG